MSFTWFKTLKQQYILRVSHACFPYGTPLHGGVFPVLSCPVLSLPFLSFLFFFASRPFNLGCGASSCDSSDRQTFRNMACGKLLLLLHCGQNLLVGLVLNKGRRTNWETGRQNMASVNCFWSVSMWVIAFGWSDIGNQYRCSMHGKWAGLLFLLMVSCLLSAHAAWLFQVQGLNHRSNSWGKPVPNP